MPAPVFSLLLDTRQAVAELLAECPKCGALSSQVLELAWRAKAMVCRECLTAMSLDAKVMQLLRGQAAGAMMAIDRLTRVSGAPANE